MALDRPEKQRGADPALIKQAVVPKDPNVERSAGRGARDATVPKDVNAPAGRTAPAAGTVMREVVVPKDVNAPRAPVSKARPPLGLPSGSVRALLTLLIVGVVVVETANGVALGEFWTETLLIALAHYFSSRRLVELPKPVIERLQAEGHLDEEAQPLYLPRHSIRGLIFASFIGLAVYLHQEGRLVSVGEGLWGLPHINVSAPILVVFVYFLGVLTKPIAGWWVRFRGRRSSAWWGDLKASVVLIVLAAIALAHLTGQAERIPDALDHFTLGLVLFYFGSR